MAEISIYLSYAHKDEKLANELKLHLTSLRRLYNIAILNNPIRPGSEWSKELDNNLNKANIILLLISPDFMASDYAYSVELRRAMERHIAQEAYVIPIILRSVDWESTPFSNLEMLPSNAKPIVSWADRDEAFSDVVRGIRRIIVIISKTPLTPPSVIEKTPEKIIASLPQEAQFAAKSGKVSLLKKALEEYHKKHTNERVVIENRDEYLYYEDIVQVTYIWQIWQTIIELITKGRKSLLKPLFQELFLTLASALNTHTDTEMLETFSPLFSLTSLDTQHLFANLRIAKQLPVLFYSEPTFSMEQWDDLRQILKQVNPASRFAVLFFFSPRSTSSSASKRYLQHFQQTFAYDALPMDLNNFLKITQAQDPGKLFRQWVLSQADLSIISPFTTSGPTPNEMFFGREQELRTIQEHANEASYAIIGGRRIGKTSLLKRLWRISLPEQNMHAFYQDCSYIQKQADLVQAVSLDRSWFPTPPASSFSSFANVIQALPNDKPLVLLLDEADKLIEPDRAAGYPLLSMLRAFSMSGRCQYIFSGEYALRTDMQNPQSPLFNFANMLLIGHLDMRAAHKLIVQPMRDLAIELVDEEMIVKRIWSFTAGHPNVIQRLCQRLLKKINGHQHLRLDIKDVEEVLTTPDFLRDDFLDTYWGQATLLERLCTLVMASRQNIHTLVDIHTELISVVPGIFLVDVSDALERLVSLRNLLRRASKGYIFAVTDFPKVIAQTYELNDLLALTYDKYKREVVQKHL